MEQIIRIGMDTSKNVFQLHGVDAAEKPVLRKKLARREMVKFFEKLAPTIVAIEACGASHHWARFLASLGHDVKLIAPQLAKPYVKRGKNDAADAEALCEAASRPTMRFVPVKTADQQAALMLVPCAVASAVRVSWVEASSLPMNDQRQLDSMPFRVRLVCAPTVRSMRLIGPLIKAAWP